MQRKEAWKEKKQLSPLRRVPEARDNVTKVYPFPEERKQLSPLKREERKQLSPLKLGVVIDHIPYELNSLIHDDRLSKLDPENLDDFSNVGWPRKEAYTSIKGAVKASQKLHAAFDAYRGTSNGFDAYCLEIVEAGKFQIQEKMVLVFDYLSKIMKENDTDTYTKEHDNTVDLRQNIFAVIREFSMLARFPSITARLTGVAEDKHDHLLFTFALRNILSRIAFRTVLRKTIEEALRGLCDRVTGSFRWVPGGSIATSFCLVGFNRLLSPNNKIGASLSSDIDYKLVVDLSIIGIVDGDGFRALRPSEEDKFMKHLNGEMATLQDNFRAAGMELEVEDFTTKSIDRFKREILSVPSETNFAASIKNNKTPIAGDIEGNTCLYKRFERALNTVINVPTLAYNQYLGETDKASIEVIKHIKKLDMVLQSCEPVVTEVVSKVLRNDVVFLSKLLGTDSKIEPKMINYIGSFGSNPRYIKAALKDTRVCTALTNEAKKNGSALAEALEELPIFHDETTLKRIKKVAKVLSNFVPEDPVLQTRYSQEYSTECLKHVGSDYVTRDNGGTIDWRFSLKYGLCRLSDYFDSVTKEEYVGAQGNRLEYDAIKKLASILNKFALRMQNLTYRLGFMEKLTHADIDLIYARITKARFMKIRTISYLDKILKGYLEDLVLQLRIVQFKFDQAGDGLLTALVTSQRMILPNEVPVPTPIESCIEKANNIIEHGKNFEKNIAEHQALEFFIALYDLVDEVGKALRCRLVEVPDPGAGAEAGRGGRSAPAEKKSIDIDLGSPRGHRANMQNVFSDENDSTDDSTLNWSDVMDDDSLLSDDSISSDADSEFDDDEEDDGRLEALANRIDALEEKVIQMGEQMKRNFESLRRRFIKHQQDIRRYHRRDYDPGERKEIIWALRFLERKLLY